MLMGPTEGTPMPGTQRQLSSKPGPSGPRGEVKDTRQLRTLLPRLTPGVIFRLLLGVLLFLFGIIWGAWLILRFRRHRQDSNALDS